MQWGIINNMTETMIYILIVIVIIGGVDTKLKYMRNEFEIPMSPANPTSKQYSMREIISKI